MAPPEPSSALKPPPSATLQHLEAARGAYQRRHITKAQTACDEALQADPNCALAYYYRGLTYFEQRRYDAMHADFTQATALDAHNIDMLTAIATLMIHLNDCMRAIGLLHRVLEINAEAANSWTMLAECYYRVGKTDAAKGIVERALQKCPSHTGLTFLQAALLPQILFSAAEGEQALDRYMQHLDRLMQEKFTMANPVKDTVVFPFYHAYYGRNCKAFMARLAAFFTSACPDLRYEAPHCRVLRAPKAKLRVGFVTELMHADTIMQFFSGMLDRLATDEALEVVLISISHLPPAAGATPDRHYRCIALTGDVPAVRERLAAEAFDVLMYLDLGLGKYCYFTAFARLAPVQCTWGGHPLTTGIPTIDYFLTTECCEADHPQAHYTETPVVLKHSITYYQPEALPTHAMSRRELGLPEDKRLYACPVQLFKIHPDMDAAFARILERDPQGLIILFAPTLPLFRPQMEARFNQTIPPQLRQRIVFLPFAKKDLFPHMLRAMDALLDPFHFSFGTTAYILFSLGLPFATWRGEFYRGRAGHWMYSRMDMPEMISPTHEAYADMAVRLAGDTVFRAEVSAKIRERSHIFFHNEAAVTELAECLKRLYAASPP